MSRQAAIRIFVLFALGYFLSYVYRGLNIGFAPFLSREMNLTASDLGLLTSFYFIGFALAQLPAGLALDRYGARRTDAVLLLVAAAGTVLYGMTHHDRRGGFGLPWCGLSGDCPEFSILALAAAQWPDGGVRRHGRCGGRYAAGGAADTIHLAGNQRRHGRVHNCRGCGHLAAGT